MSDKQTQIDKENVTIGCYISLALAIVFFSGVAAGSSYFWSFLDFTTLMGSAGKVVGKVTETADGVSTTMTTIRGLGGSGAIDGFMLAISLIIPGVMLAMGMITVFEHYGALKAARKLLTPILQFLIGVPGTATLALIACLQSTDGGAALTRQLKDSGALSYTEINNFSAFQMVACAPITNFVTFSAAVLAFSNADGSSAVPLSMGTGLAVLLIAKVIGANIMRLIQLRIAQREKAATASLQTSPVALTIERN
jgi:putative membrane protein